MGGAMVFGMLCGAINKVMIDKIKTSQLIQMTSRGAMWNLGNDILYQLCSRYPEHKSPEVIAAKIWLIGRAYAAAIERRKNKDEEEKNDNFYESTVVPIIQKSALDEYLEKIRKFRNITNESIPAILETHKYLTDVFTQISGIEKRSLASKYLHFHCPNLFFLYDSRAVKSSRRLLHRLVVDIPPQNIDEEYGKFFLKLVHLRDLIYKQEGCLLSPREIDNILINFGS
jgi:hypothetical protein